ncbi:RDD family protein [Erythrobacter ani]|uniref:RDD family protein n=1 Tax=Erythrobacter ani TaxID=2827235 RepID=A0ABS6SND5_9SPHN|nr:RDD family protein [Erythrobacter ani]MBV7266546.1 RDD family protein [Erythrobacter ani]
MIYAGFWIRLLAYIIDTVILALVGVVLGVLTGVALFSTGADAELGAFDLISLVIGIAYFVGFEASHMQGTPGKRALGLIVTDTDGRRISALRAAGRYFAKILSAIILLIGFIMAAFTERKQGLHDLIASTLVLKAAPGEGAVDMSVFE